MPSFNDFNNAQVARLPGHLKQFIVDQLYDHYTPVDQAVWRYVMRQNHAWLKDVAYYPYIPGLKKAGLTIERIPNLQEMNDALGTIGWGAVTVDGFIPPAAFMEYQAYRVLVIAADIRQLNHIAYTPAPDIIHESAGHAPIIAEKDYHEYLSYFGAIGAKAIFSAEDFQLYEAIRSLSILKEMPDADPAKLKAAEELVEFRQANIGEPSEMALLSRLHWWTVEYGLIGSLADPKIYGAGLLSSIGESAACMKDHVAKIPYSIDAINYTYDITRPQPQLFVTPDFQNLVTVLDQFADTMSFRRGGVYGLQKAIASKNNCAAVYSSGLEVSGTFTRFDEHQGHPAFIKTTGPSALSVNGKQLNGHGKGYHKDGFSSPVGRLRDQALALEDFSDEDLTAVGVVIGQKAILTFESGIAVRGLVENILTASDKILLITFVECTVKDATGSILFDPSWGKYDMAVGECIVSVFSGAADKDAFEEIAYRPSAVTHHPVYDENTLELHRLYQQVHNCRQQVTCYQTLRGVWKELQSKHQEDWLCALEILEILKQADDVEHIAQHIDDFLGGKARQEPELHKLIHDGLNLIRQPVD